LKGKVESLDCFGLLNEVEIEDEDEEKEDEVNILTSLYLEDAETQGM
jgi:hypothetical protein